MSRKEEQWRAEGMAFCVRYLEANGGDVDALKAEIKRRGAYSIPLAITKAEEQEYTERVKQMCIDHLLLLTLGVLHDCFGFGHERMRRFKEKFEEGATYLTTGEMEWDELQESIEKDYNIEVRR